MKKLILVSIFLVLLTSCSQKEETKAAITKISFKVMSDENHPAEITTGAYESNNFSEEDVAQVQTFPFEKEYQKVVFYNADLLLRYKDKTALANFSSYAITIQILKNDVVVKQETVDVIGAGKTLTLTTSITN